MDTKLLARKILASGDLEKETYTLNDLFKIRDALNILDAYGFADQDLLKEVKLFIAQMYDPVNLG
jgi:hypothetical protein